MEQIKDSQTQEQQSTGFEERHDTGFQQPADYASAVSQAWGELDLDPRLNGNPAMSPSGETCCACY
jgi:hypothetical protein